MSRHAACVRSQTLWKHALVRHVHPHKCAERTTCGLPPAHERVRARKALSSHDAPEDELCTGNRFEPPHSMCGAPTQPCGLQCRAEDTSQPQWSSPDRDHPPPHSARPAIVWARGRGRGLRLAASARRVPVLGCTPRGVGVHLQCLDRFVDRLGGRASERAWVPKQLGRSRSARPDFPNPPCQVPFLNNKLFRPPKSEFPKFQKPPITTIIHPVYNFLHFHRGPNTFYGCFRRLKVFTGYRGSHHSIKRFVRHCLTPRFYRCLFNNPFIRPSNRFQVCSMAC